MVIDKNNLPDDPALLKEMIAELTMKHESLDQKYSYLEEKYKTLQRLLFGKKSEKLTKEDEHQMRLFNETEDGAGGAGGDDDDESETATATTRVAEYTRRKGGRKPLPDHIHREEIIHDLAGEERACPCCGKDRPLIGEDAMEELDIIPAKIIVNRHIRRKYGPCVCRDFQDKEIPEVKTASMPPRLVPHSIVSPGLAAYIVTAKFCDALPFYRQSNIFSRLDIDISRATLCNWAMAVAERCEVLIGLMSEEIRGGPVLRMDETVLQVLKEPGRPAESTSYMWVTMGYAPGDKPLLLYQYHPTRSGDVPKRFLEGYAGFLQTDGYGGYNRAVEGTDITHVGCFAHARRYFEKAWKLNKKSKVAYRGLEYIKNIYTIEREMRSANLGTNEFLERREKAAASVLDAFHNWLESQADSVLPQSSTGVAIGYCLSEWGKLVAYVNHHLLTPDNNLIENAIRPFVLGRKNWLFSNTPRGAQSSAVLYSLIESAKANGLEPYRYLRYIFDRLPGASTKEQLRVLLPDLITPEMIKLAD